MNNINKEKVIEKLGKYVNVCNLPSQYIDTKPTLNVFVVIDFILEALYYIVYHSRKNRVRSVKVVGF